MKKIFLLFSVFALTLGCQPQKLGNDRLDDGFRMMERKDYDSAIRYFESLGVNGDPRVRIALASAYAGRAGVQISDYWGFVEKIRGRPITPDRVRQEQIYQDSAKKLEPIAIILTDENKKSFDSLFQSVAAMSIYRERLNALPYIRGEQRGSLRHAIDLLEGTPNTGGRVYRALLVATFLRSSLDDGFDVWRAIQDHIQDLFHSPETAVATFCTPVTGDFTLWLSDMFHYATSTSQDLAVAFPSNASDYQPFSEGVTALANQLPDVQKALVPSGCH